jgi:hypothetical protein
MRIVFAKVHASDPGRYVQQKLEDWITASHPSDHRFEPALFETLTSHVLASGFAGSLPVAERDAFYDITRPQSREVEARKRCMIQTVRRESPLLPGEEVVEDFPTFLAKDWSHFGRNTAVLRRRTNLADLYYIFDGVQVVAGDIVFLARPPAAAEPQPPARAALRAEGINIKWVFTNLGSGLISGVGGKIAALIFDAVFPPGVPSYFDEVYEEIRSIVRQEIAQGTVDQINGQINGLTQWVRNTYSVRKADKKVPRKELYEMLSPKVDDLNRWALGPLMTNPYATPGLPVFMVAAGMHMALLQEQALMDPDTDDPRESSYAKTIGLSAQAYRDHAVGTFNKIRDTRLGKITLKYDPYIFCNESCSSKSAYRWIDEQTGARGQLREQYMDSDKKSHDGSEEATADMNAHKDQARTDLINSLGDPVAVAEKWLLLLENPIPAAPRG